MAFIGTLLIPDEGKDILLEDLVDILHKIENNKADEILKKKVFKLSSNVIKDFLFLNTMCNNLIYALGDNVDRIRLNKDIAILNYPYKLFDVANRLLGTTLALDKDYELNIYKDLQVYLMSELSELGLDKKIFNNNNLNELGLIVYKLMTDNSDFFNLLYSLVIDTFKIPYSDGSLLILVINQNSYRKIINTLYKVVKDYLEVNINSLMNIRKTENINIPIKLSISDIIKKEIEKEPGINNIIIDQPLYHINKSFMILPDIFE